MSMAAGNPRIYDASALLAVVFNEPGAEAVLEHLAQPGGEISAVNWSEVAAKLAERGLRTEKISGELSAFGLDIVPFDEVLALHAAALRPLTRTLGLSFGDRACLALTQLRGGVAITADASWRRLRNFQVVTVR